MIKQISLFRFLSRSILLSFVIVSLSFGHAHIFIDYKVHACVSDEGLDGIYVNWTFDRMFTQFIHKEFDIDKDGKLNKTEQQNIYNKSFKDYKKNKYFTVIEVDGKNYSIPEPTNFSARIIPEKDFVAFTFYLPLKIKPEKKEKDIVIHFFDPVIYVAFTVMKDDISIQNKSKSIEAAISLKQIKYANHTTISLKEKL